MADTEWSAAGQQVTCRSCGRTWTCAAEDDYYGDPGQPAPAGPDQGRCFDCLCRGAGLDPARAIPAAVEFIDHIAAARRPVCDGGFDLAGPRVHAGGSRCFHAPGDCRCAKTISPHSPAWHAGGAAAPPFVAPLDITIEQRPGRGWCVVLRCPGGSCRCGRESIIGGFPCEDAAHELAGRMQRGWQASRQAWLIRAENAAQS